MHRRAYIFLLLTTFFWGGNAIAGKLAVGHVSPMLLTAIRWGLTCAIMIIIGWPNLKSDWPRIREHWLLLSILGTLGFTLFNVALYSALALTTAINVSIEQAGMPMLIFLFNFLFFGLKASWAQIVGLCLTLFGVTLTAAHGDLSRLMALDLNLGDVIMLSSIAVFSAYTVLMRFKPSIHWQSLMIALTGSAFLTSLPFVAGEYALDAAIWPDKQGWIILLYVLIFPSLVAQALYIMGVELIGANRAGLFINLVPIFGTLLSIILLGEDFHLYHAVALVLVFGGIALAEYRAPR
jgi:drug/metabolite transporter (DMT)-like permease